MYGVFKHSMVIPNIGSKNSGQGGVSFQLKLATYTTVPHWPVLMMLQGDTPFMEKLFKLASHTSYGACYRCCLEGEHLAGAVRCVLKQDDASTVHTPQVINPVIFGWTLVVTQQPRRQVTISMRR